jgi:DNA-binding GntR family transcriptional regulator
MRVKRETVQEQAVQLLRSQILERQLLPGSPVTEEAMARDIGISRATMREVLNTLISEGLLTRNVTTRVLHVTQLGPETIREIYRARRLLEAGAVRAFAGRKDATLDALCKATDDLIKAIASSGGKEVVESDIACHIETVALAGSADLAAFYSKLLGKLRLAMTTVTNSGHYDMRLMGADHVAFVELLRSGRFDEAEKVVIDRLDRAEAQLLKAVQER